MKKVLLKAIVFSLLFVVSVIVIGIVMNKSRSNMTIEMQAARLPIITMEREGIQYNPLHGYKAEMAVAFQRDSVSVLGENRDIAFTIDTYGRAVNGIQVEVRNTDGERLIESTPVLDYKLKDQKISAGFIVKDLIERDTEYELVIILTLDETEAVRYYTRIIWGDNLHELQKLYFAKDFHKKTLDKEAAREITKYLETDASLADNTSFHKVNIHSTFKQITWGDLPICEASEPTFTLKEIATQTATLVAKYMVATNNGTKTVRYLVREDYQVRYSPTRMYLLDFERTMTQLPNPEQMYANDKILLGITDENVPIIESEDGNIVVFEVANALYSYNIATNKLASVFCFYDIEDLDARALNDQHAIKVLDVTEGGNITFAVYGYLNRGRHEGEVGIQVYLYDQELNTVEEQIFIPYDKPYTVMKTQIQKLLFLSREQVLYITLDNGVYAVNLVDKSVQRLVDINCDDCVQISNNNRMMVWQNHTGGFHDSELNIINLGSMLQKKIFAENGEVIVALAFMGEDVIYGVAREEDIVQEITGETFCPMYKICIANSTGDIVKEYQQPDIFITDCNVVENQIVLSRVVKEEKGGFRAVDQDHIMNNVHEEQGKNVIASADIDIYERYVQIKVKKNIDPKTIKHLTPKEVLFEGDRRVEIENNTTHDCYYVYSSWGVEKILFSPANAIREAYTLSGTVVDTRGACVWLRGNRVPKNQIMAIKEEKSTEEKSSLAVCVDTILQFEGVMSNSQPLLERGETLDSILQEGLGDATVLDLTGCILDAILYYTNRDIPVLALLNNGEAVLVTGFNEYNVVIMEPSTGRLYKKGMNDSKEWFSKNGNRFMTYVKQ